MANPVAGFPDATNTGPASDAKLTTYTGPSTISQSGTVIENQVINGSLKITGSDVVLKNCVINFDSTWGVDAENAHNITIENCTITGPGTSADTNSAILGSGNFLNNNISGTENGITLTDGASKVTGNYIHDLANGASDPHYDGISVQGGQNGVLIQDNTISGRDTSDIFIKDDFGAINDVTVNHNLLIGDPGYNLYVDGRGGNGAITNVTVSDNYVEKGYYGTFSVDGSSPHMSGNTVFAAGETVSAGSTSSGTGSTSTTTDPGTPTTGTTSGDTSSSGSSSTGTSAHDSGHDSGSTASSGSSTTGSSTTGSSTSGTHTGTASSGSGSSSSGSNHDSFDFGHGRSSHGSSSSHWHQTASSGSGSSAQSHYHSGDSGSSDSHADSVASHHDWSNDWHHGQTVDHFTM